MSSESGGSKDPEVRCLDSFRYRFSNRALFIEAITHRSYTNEVARELSAPVRDNERLEFLGDAVLDLVVSTELMRRFPDANEGKLSRMRAAIVHEGALAELARRTQLGAALRLGRGEERSGGRDRTSLLADAFEAVVGAVYLDSGFERVSDVVVPLLDFESGDRLADTDAKTELQQRFQAEHKMTPRYRLVTSEGPEHDKWFVVEVVVDGQVLGQGSGRSKKQAEQQAALSILQSWGDE